MPAPPPPGAGSSGSGGGSVVSELKARLGPASFSLLQQCSIRYQRGEAAAEEYYELALDILQGDAASLLRLVDKLPDAAKREAVRQCHEAAVSQLEEQIWLEEQLAAEAAADGASAGEGAAGLPLAGNVFVDEDVQEEQEGWQAAPGKADSSTDGGSRSSLQGNRLWANQDGQPLGEVVTQFMPPWQEAAAEAAPAAAATQQGVRSYKELAAARRSGVSSSGCGGSRAAVGGGSPGSPAAAADVPTSTPWLLPGDVPGPGRSTSAAGRPGLADTLADLALGPPHQRSGTGPRTSTSNTTSSSVGSGRSTSRPAPVVVWLRRDLRLADNPALHAAASTGRPVLPVFIWAPQECGRWPPGGAVQYWLHHSLASLDGELQRRHGGRLRCFDASGSSSAQVLLEIVRQAGAAEVVWNRLYEPWSLTRDAEVELVLTGRCQLAHRQLLPYHTLPRPSTSSMAASSSIGSANGTGSGTAGSSSSGGGAGGATGGCGCPHAVSVRTFNGSLLYEPWDAAPDQQDESSWYGGYGSVGFFTSSCQRLGDPAEPLPAPDRLSLLPAGAGPPGCSIAALGLGDLPVVGPQQAQRTGRPAGVHDWAAGIRQTWRFGEAGAAAALEEFLQDGLQHFDARSDAKTIQPQRYEEEDGPAGSSGLGRAGSGRRKGTPAPPSERFRADRRYTARISPYLAWGELSPRQVYHAALERYGPRRAKTFLRRLAWRDLAYWALWRFPWMAEEPLRPQYAAQRWDLWWRGPVELASLRSRFRRWQPEDARLLAWQRGTTGFPLVDAGMRELWATGYIPNYVRHIVAGFLIEILNIDWRHGALWFHDTLCDADVAINALMWQNGGHSGMDQWNFVLDPVFAAKAADPEGHYVRRWCPELSRLSVPFIHAPWEAPPTTLAAAGVTLGRHYPRRIVTDLDAARRASLAAVVDMRRSPAGRKYVLPDGNDALPLPDGRFARAITRIDYRQMAEKPVTKQAAADLWDKGRRPLRDPMAVAMQDALRGSLGPGRPGGGGGRGLG